MAPRKPAALKPAELRRSYSPADIPFDTSDQVPVCHDPVVGQARAREALEFALAMDDMSYHVYVAGPQFSGRTHLVRSFVEKIAAAEPAPPDWVYVHNFRSPDQPLALRLPTGGSRALAKDMSELVQGLKKKIPDLFESDEYTAGKEALAGRFKRRRSQIFSDLDQQARGLGYALRFESTGIMVAPAGPDGEPLPESAIREMSPEAREELRGRSDQVQARVAESLRAVSALEKELSQAVREMDRDAVLHAVGHLLDELKEKYAELPEVLAYLEQVREEVVDNYERFKKKEAPQLPFPVTTEEPSFKEFEVNVFVDHSETKGAPLRVLSHPTYPNLFGRIERQAHFGALLTDFTLLRPGALHKANGGYLVIPVVEILRQWLPWEGLKRSLKERKIVMEDALEQLGYISARTLRPQPIPLDIKVILVGETSLFHLLHEYDPLFPKLFKIRAQMTDRMEWSPSEIKDFIAHICTAARERDMLPLQRGGMARLIELAAELADDRERLTLRLALVEDVLKEGDFFARKSGRKAITAPDVDKAIAKRRYRDSLMEERLRESVTRGFIQVETSGERVGQINGLAVLGSGDYAFGQPSRITASVGLGKEGVLAIDREADLSGPFHTKGVMILSGFLRDRFAANGPMTMTASLVFEQSYGLVDGDSASLAELLVLISRLSGLPLRQDLAVTGSLSQQGQVQAIGGINAKIEGFFRLCEERGLTGSQGVVMPQSNVKNLMLHPDIVAAAKRRRFAVYPVSGVDEALEIFTGVKSGQRGPKGQYPRGSVNYLVETELERLRQAARADNGNGNGNGKR